MLKDLKEKKQVKYTPLRVKITNEMKEMIEYISEKSGVDKDEYLREILAKSEIQKVYNLLKKDEKNSSVNDSSMNDNYSDNEYR